MWELEYDQKSFAIEQHLRLHRPLPQGLQEVVDSEPVLEEFEWFYQQAYWNLYTERGGSSATPWSKIVEYGERFGLDSDMIKVLVMVTRTLEARHNSWTKGERTRQELVNKPSPAQRQKSVSKRNG